MKKLLLLLLAVCLLTGCGREESVPETKPAAPAVTEAPPQTTEAAHPIDTVILAKSKTLSVSYVLTAVNPYGEYGQDVSINAQGAEALAKWLLGQTALDQAATFRDGLFLAAEDAPVYSGWIAKASEATKTIRLMTTVDVDEVGLLEEILPAFEEEYGYEVEIIAVEEREMYLTAALGEADLVLAPAPREGDVFGSSDSFRKLPGFQEIHIPLLRCPYVLCGPSEDPAGAAKAADLSAALKAIADARCCFISRGDGSEAHQAELALWGKTPEGDWYFSADTQMGPCLTIAEEMGGYVLCDGLTYEIFRTLNGIIA